MSVGVALALRALAQIETIDVGAGSEWFTGSGAPAGATGVVGDFYLNTATGDYYEKTGASAWTLRGNLAGANGTNGTNGTNGIDGIDGIDGRTVLNGVVAPTTEGVDGDFYIDTVTSTIYGPKAAGVWPAGVSLVGATGPAGPAGGIVPADGMVIVKHGAVAGTARPTAGSVYWQGSVDPTNRALGDFWLNTPAYD